MRYELGYNILSAGAEPYISYVAIFDKVIQVYINPSAITTSTTAVPAAGQPTQQTIVVANPSVIVAGDTVVIDVDSHQEVVTAESIAGSNLTVYLALSHGGTYPITVQGGESIVREKLRQLAKAQDRLTQMLGAGSLKKVDEVEFYGTGDRSAFAVIRDSLMALRDELAGALGVENLWRYRTGGGGMAVNY